MMEKSNVIGRLIVLFVLFITIVSHDSTAYSVEKIEIQDTLNDDLSIDETLTISIVNNTLDSLSFTLPTGAHDIFVHEVSQQSVNDSVTIPLSCESCIVILQYSLRDAVKKTDSDAYTFSRTLSFHQSPQIIDYYVKIPPGYVLSPLDTNNDPSIVPLPNEIQTDGVSIIVFWSENTPALPQRYYLSYHGHEGMESPVSEFTNELGEWPVWILAIFSMCLGFAVCFLVNRLKKSPEPAPSIPSFVLTSDEKAVLALLKKNKNEMNQKEIGKQLNWSKSKVSATMTNLSSKKIISREKFGRNYKVTVVRDVKDF